MPRARMPSAVAEASVAKAAGAKVAIVGAAVAETAGVEANFDGLVGPTHNYAGLGHGNVASQANRRKPANPRAAALQGLDKMRRLSSLGLAQAVVPPLFRPDLEWLRRLGFSGKDEEVLAKAARERPEYLAAASSASSMWTANAATVSPARDSSRGRMQVTAANLGSQIHRSLEGMQTSALLRRLLPGPRFEHHEPLPLGRHFGDEGAANHTRLAPTHGSPGLEVFAYGYRAGGERGRRPATGFQPRQSLEASEAVARLHGLDPARTAFLRQHPDAIAAGVFHNDVIAVGNENVFLCHEKAYENQAAGLRELRRKYSGLPGSRERPLHVLEVKAKEVGLREAVSTYLFNSQILTLPDGGMLLLAAEECRKSPRVRAYLERLPAKGLPIRAVEYADLRQSMRNGGGPACLRLRLPLSLEAWADVPAGVKVDDALHARLRAWVEKHYRDRIVPGDLADPSLLRESRAALDALTGILGLGSIYPFQR